MKQSLRTAIYLVCVAVAIAVLLGPAVCRLATSAPQPFTSRHPASTLPPLMGFAADSILNVGDIAAIDAFPGIGEVYAQRIIEGRSSFGGYLLPTDLLLVKGIGEKRMRDILAALDEALVEIPLGTE